LTPEDAKFVQVPECEPETGKFKPVQCNGGGCYCVDSQGFELPGTRAKSLDAVNCTSKLWFVYNWIRLKCGVIYV